MSQCFGWSGRTVLSDWCKTASWNMAGQTQVMHPRMLWGWSAGNIFGSCSHNTDCWILGPKFKMKLDQHVQRIPFEIWWNFFFFTIFFFLSVTRYVLTSIQIQILTEKYSIRINITVRFQTDFGSISWIITIKKKNLFTNSYFAHAVGGVVA